MRKTPISVASVCLLIVALAAPLTAQAGGKKKHAVDSSHTVQTIQTVQTDQTVEAPIEETTGIRRAEANNGRQIVMNWEFKDRGGSAKLIVNQNGTYIFSGHYDNKKPDRGFDCILSLKAFLGYVFQWYHVGNISKGGIKWSEQGQSDLVRANFNYLSHGKYVWGGAYRFPTLAEVKKWKKAVAADCAAGSWMNKQEWAQADPGQECHQFNDKLY